MANYKTEEGTPLFEEGEKMHDENCDLLDQLNEYSDEDKDIEQGEEEEEGDYWYVCYQDEEHDMTWNKFKNEKVARDGYETYQGKKARILYYNAVVEKDGDKTLTESMKKFADKTYKIAFPTRAYFSLFLFSVVLISFTWSRNILTEAYGYKGKGDGKTFYDIIADVPSLTPSKFGTLAGIWQTLCYAPCTLIAGGITDKVNRKNLVLFTSIIGGLSTAGNYFAAKNDYGYLIMVIMRCINSATSAFC